MRFPTREAAEAALPELRSGIEVLLARTQPKGEALMRVALQKVANKVSPDRLPVRGHFVYVLWGDDDRRPLYVGESGSLLGRLGNHYRNHGQGIRSVQIFECESRTHRLEVEQHLIWVYQPTHNRVWGGQQVAWNQMPADTRRPPSAGRLAGRVDSEPAA